MSRLEEIRERYARMRPIADAGAWPADGGPVPVFQRTYDDYGILLGELERLSSWDGLMSVLDEHYPADVFNGSSGDPGARIVVLVREIDRLRAALRKHGTHAWTCHHNPAASWSGPCSCGWAEIEKESGLGPDADRVKAAEGDAP